MFNVLPKLIKNTIRKLTHLTCNSPLSFSPIERKGVQMMEEAAVFCSDNDFRNSVVIEIYNCRTRRISSKLALSESAPHGERPAFIRLFDLAIKLYIPTIEEKIFFAVTVPIGNAELPPSALSCCTIGFSFLYLETRNYELETA